MDDEQITATIAKLRNKHAGKSTRANKPQQDKPKPAKDVLIELAEDAELFHTPDGTAYADITVNGHRETWPVRVRGFKRWLHRCYYEKTESAPNADATQAALGIIEAKAFYDAPERVVATRLAALAGRIYIDLCDEDWQAIEIDEDGWRIVDEVPVRFRRAAGMLPLPIPERGGNIAVLRKYLNLTTAKGAGSADDKFVLIVCVILAYMRARGPFPVLALTGPEGTCKTTLAAIIKALTDPNASALRALPREDRDLFIAATIGWVLAFDNVSYLPDWISDTLCRLATGGGFATRQLYSDSDEVLFDAMRPVVLNGIEDFVARPDLADRAVFLPQEPVPDKDRRAEAEFWAAFEQDKPHIFGALLDMVVHGLGALPDVKLKRLPRMADFAKWAVACERAAFPAGSFMKAYKANRRGAVETVLEGDLVATALRAFMTARAKPWEGTATELFTALGDSAGDRLTKAKEWPKAPNKLSGRLRRTAHFLRKVGIDVVFPDRTNVGRLITITRDDTAPNDDSLSGRPLFLDQEEEGQPDWVRNLSSLSSPSSPAAETGEFQAHSGDDTGDDTGDSIVTAKPLDCNGSDDSDDSDDKMQHRSGRGGVCRHCGASDRPGDPVQEVWIDGEQHLLHRGCRDMPIGSRTVGVAAGQRCEHCGKGRDVHLVCLPGEPEAAPRHKQCAARYWEHLGTS
jgi:hypothetical protein